VEITEVFLSHPENAEDAEILRVDVRDIAEIAGSAGMFTTMFFRHDEQDGHDDDGAQGCHDDIF